MKISRVEIFCNGCEDKRQFLELKKRDTFGKNGGNGREYQKNFCRSENSTTGNKLFLSFSLSLNTLMNFGWMNLAVPLFFLMARAAKDLLCTNFSSFCCYYYICMLFLQKILFHFNKGCSLFNQQVLGLIFT